MFLQRPKACTLIRQDVRNNSAWNQRWFVSHRAKAQPLDLQAARQEADFALGDDGAKQDPYNESPWRYLIGIMKEQMQRANTNDAFADLVVEYEAKAKALECVLTNANRNPDTCVDMTSARVDLLEMIGTKDSLTTAITLAEGLANEHDTVRTKYWSLVLKRLRNKQKLLTFT